MLCAQIQDADAPEPRRLRWGFWHLNCLAAALDTEGHDGGWPAEYTFTQQHEFLDETDGEVLKLYPGTTARFWRDR